MAFIWVGLYLVLGGLGAIARLFEIILPITIVVFVFSLLLSSKIFEIDNLLPVLGDGVFPVLKGVGSTVLVFLGHELIRITSYNVCYTKLLRGLDPNADDNHNGHTNYEDYAVGADPTALVDPSLYPTLNGSQLTLGYRDT